MKTENIFYRHCKTGNIYRVVSRDILLEDPTTKEWVPGVLYEEYLHIDKKEDGTRVFYVVEPRRFMRSKDRFKERFEPWVG